MSDPRAQIQQLRTLIEAAPALPERSDWLARLAAIEQALPTAGGNPAETERLRQDVEDAEHARDAANLQRMKVAGQLNTLHKSLAAAVPEVPAGKDAQSDALRRIEHLVAHGASAPGAVEAAKAAEMDAPMPGRAVLEAVIAGERKFTKAQLEFTIAEAMVLTGWAKTPLELMQEGEPWLAELILKNQADAT
ncbi:hypothetical protein [Arenimonas sp. MALMAid1274]|uniref:hypothetical protein n=1 Tax=Arenimonas sp. MALMAid1274 TaxID=3411630 RepID=UPI003BA1A31E